MKKFRNCCHIESLSETALLANIVDASQNENNSFLYSELVGGTRKRSIYTQN